MLVKNKYFKKNILNKNTRFLVKKLISNGIFTKLVPVEYGGSGGELTELCSTMEEIGKTNYKFGNKAISQAVGALAIRFGFNENEHQKIKYYPNIIKTSNVTYAVIEEYKFNHLKRNIETNAVFKKNNYVINGKKLFIGNARNIEYYITLVKSDNNRFTFFWIEKNYHGISFGRLRNTIDWEGLKATEIIFDNTIVPKDQIMGEAGNGLKLGKTFSRYIRLSLAALCLGCAQKTLQNLVEKIEIIYKSSEHNYDSCEIHSMILKMQTKVENYRNTIYENALKIDVNKANMEIYTSEFEKSDPTDNLINIIEKCLEIIRKNRYTDQFHITKMVKYCDALRKWYSFF